MPKLKDLPPTMLANMVGYLLGENDTVLIPLSGLNDVEQRLEMEYGHERISDREYVRVDAVDIDSDTTDVPPEGNEVTQVPNE